MSSVELTVTTSWIKIFNIQLYGYFGVYIYEQADNLSHGSVLFMENGNLSSNETTIANFRGINLLSYLIRNLPMEFHFENYPSRIYEIQKNNDYLEVRITSGTDISVKFTLFSEFPNKNIIFTPKKDNYKNSSFIRTGAYSSPLMKNGTASSISYMDSDVTSYDIQIFDKDNKQVLLTKNLTNTNESIQDLGVLTNLPTLPTQIEISIKKNGGNKSSKIYIENVTICYN